MSTLGFHPEIVPYSVAKRKSAGCPLASAKLVVPLKTMPVGADGLLPLGGGGMVTTSGWLGDGPGVPLPRYTVETPVLLTAIQSGPPGADAMPHGLTKLASIRFAMPEASSATRFSCL